MCSNGKELGRGVSGGGFNGASEFTLAAILSFSCVSLVCVLVGGFSFPSLWTSGCTWSESFPFPDLFNSSCRVVVWRGLYPRPRTLADSAVRPMLGRSTAGADHFGEPT